MQLRITVIHADTTSGSIPVWRHNQEADDMSTSRAWISHPGRGWRLQTYPHTTQRNKALTKRNGCTSEPLKAPTLKQRRRQVFSTHHPWQSPSWHSFNMGSPLGEWRPQPLGTPDTPLLWLAVPALVNRCVQPALQRQGDGFLWGQVIRELGDGGRTQANALKRMMSMKIGKAWICCTSKPPDLEICKIWQGVAGWVNIGQIGPTWTTRMHHVSLHRLLEVSRQMGMEMSRQWAHFNLAPAVDPVMTLLSSMQTHRI